MRTIQPLAKRWAVTRLHHAGIAIVSTRTVQQNDLSAFVRGLATLAEGAAEESWTDRLIYLTSLTAT
ncbi:MAG TPA: hypothetical protein VFC51_11150 [Chloroflexota bacterium]|nr:hypothetical protein [Chloroflexota bacterium]